MWEGRKDFCSEDSWTSLHGCKAKLAGSETLRSRFVAELFCWWVWLGCWINHGNSRSSKQYFKVSSNRFSLITWSIVLNAVDEKCAQKLRQVCRVKNCLLKHFLDMSVHCTDDTVNFESPTSNSLNKKLCFLKAFTRYVSRLWTWKDQLFMHPLKKIIWRN